MIKTILIYKSLAFVVELLQIFDRYFIGDGQMFNLSFHTDNFQFENCPFTYYSAIHKIKRWSRSMKRRGCVELVNLSFYKDNFQFRKLFSHPLNLWFTSWLVFAVKLSQSFGRYWCSWLLIADISFMFTLKSK